MNQEPAASGLPASPQPDAALRTIAIIGAGPAGRDFAFRCASAGYDVILEDVMPSNLRRAQEDYSALHPTAGTLTLASTVEDAVRTADLAIDFVPDELESKLEIFSMLDRMAPPRTALLTPTNTLSISDLASCVYRPTRCLALRGPLVPTPGATTRLIAPEAADPTLVTAVQQFLTTLGLAPVPEPDTEAPMLLPR